MKRRPLNTAFKGRGLETQDKNDVSEALFRQARRSGQLNLSNRQLTEVPSKVWKINTELPPETKNVSLDSSDEKWWDQVDLTKLILASNKLTSLSSEIVNLPALEFLDIHDNVIEALPSEIGSLENMKRINLSHNKLSSLPPDIGYLRSLCSLKLQHNSLSSVGDWLGELIHLDELDLSNNMITCLPSNLSGLGSLRNLNLSNNVLETLPAEIGQIKLLEDLNISNNKITQLPQGIGNCKSLKRLDCRQNALESFPSLGGCTSLKELYVGNNKISKIEGSDITGFPSLSVLDLRENKIEIIPDEITGLTELQRFDLANNNISGLPCTMGKMQHLKAVVLDGNPLRTIRRDIVMRGTQALLKHLKSRIVEEEKPPSSTGGGGDSVDNKVPDRPSVSLSSPSSTVDHHTLKQTKSLVYSNKKLTEIPSEVMEAAVTAGVTTVDFSKNMLSTIPNGLTELGGCLTDVNLGFNKLQSLPDSLSCFAKLQFLDLRNNQLSDLPSSLTGLVSLTEITLSYNRFSNLPSVLYSISSLRTILASDNQIQIIDVPGLLRLPVLDTLDLQNNSISQVPPELGNVTTLRALQLGGNSFRNPRATILAKGTPSLLEYLRSRIPT